MHSTIRKAASLGTAAALMASLVAVVAAPASVLADYSVTNTVTVGAGGTSTTAPTFTFNDASTAAPSSSTGFCSLPGVYAGTGTATLTVTLQDSVGNPTIHFVGTPTIVAPTSLGASVVASSDGLSFSVTISGCDPNNVEQFSVSGMQIEADTSAATGTIQALLSDNVAGAFVTAISGATTTATGTLAVAAATGATQVLVNLTSACGFSTTGSITVDSEAANTVTAVSNNGSLYTVTLGTGLSQPEAAGTAVSETGVPACNSVSPGTVAASVTQTATGATNIFPGQNNQPAGTTTVSENPGSIGVIAVDTVITFTLPAGVTFSRAPTAYPNAQIDLGNGYGVATTCGLAFTMQSCSVTVANTQAVTNATVGAVTLGGAIPTWLDVATTFGAGDINVTVTLSPSVPVVVSSSTIAYSARVIVGIGATPTVYIGYNGQPGGMVTLTEAAAGFFQSGASGNNQFQICISDQYGPLESFTFAPYAVVASGNLMLLDTSTNTGVTSAQATLNATSTCATWYVYSGSTTASTIDIVGASAAGALPIAANNGPTYSVVSTATPGPVLLTVTTGSSNTTTFSTQVTDAVRAFKTGVVVSAASQPFIAPGTTGPAGNITISETGNGYLHAGEIVTCVVLNSANNINQQVLLSTANSNSLPVVTTNTDSGLIAHLVAVNTSTNSFTLEVDQQAVAPALGTITVSNLNYTVVSGATPGPVTVECSDGTLEFTNLQPIYFFGSTFDQFVSNAVVGQMTKTYLDESSAVGVTTTSTFTLSTKVVKKGDYITLKITTTPAMAGADIGIWVAKKGADGTWSKFSPHTGRHANGQGVVYYYYKAGSIAWLSFQAHFYGDATHAPSVSNAVQARWTA